MNKGMNDLSRLIESRINGSTEESEELATLVISLMSQGYDLTPLAPRIIKLLVFPEIPLKKVLSTFLIRYSEKISNLNILATNSLTKEFKDPNPQVRRLSIKTVCCIPCMTDLAQEYLPKCLNDPSPLVRRTAANYSPRMVDANHPVVEQLYSMLRDNDSSVITSCIIALEEILQKEGGMVINSKIARYLVSRMMSFSGWAIVPICNVLQKYKPRNTEEVIEILNILDEVLDKSSTAFIPVMQLALFLIKEHCTNFEPDMIERIATPLIVLLTNSTNEVLYTLLNIIETLIPKHKVFSRHYKHFLCLFSDSIYLKVKKLSLLPSLVNEENCSLILEELFSYSTDSSPEVSNQAVNSLTVIFTSHPDQLTQNTERFTQLMQLDKHGLTDKIVASFSHLDIEMSENSRCHFLKALLKKYKEIKTLDGMESLLHLIGRYGDVMIDAPYVLENLWNDSQVEKDDRIYLMILTAAVKLFLNRPAEMQLLLGQMLQQSSLSQSSLIKTQALFYYNLLNNDVQLVSQIL